MLNCIIVCLQARRLASQYSSHEEHFSKSVEGIATTAADRTTFRVVKIKIPLVAAAESLNAAVACSMVLGEATRQRAAASQER